MLRKRVLREEKCGGVCCRNKKQKRWGRCFLYRKRGGWLPSSTDFDDSNSHVLTISETTTITTKREKIHLRIFPPLIMHPVLVRALLIALNGMLVI